VCIDAVLRCVVLCYVVLCVVLYRIVLCWCGVSLCCGVLCCVVVWCGVVCVCKKCSFPALMLCSEYFDVACVFVSASAYVWMSWLHRYCEH